MIAESEKGMTIFGQNLVVQAIVIREFFCLGHLGCAGSKGKKVDLRNSEQLFWVVFSTFGGQKKI